MQTLSGKIGILGGSFNPAHIGHYYISKQAKTLLGLDKILWLVTYRHPFKPQQESFEQRYRSALALATPPWIHVSDFEAQHKTENSYDSLSLLRERHRAAHFVFLLGADVFCQLPLWHRADDLVKTMPLAILPREDIHARACPFAARYAARILPAHQARALAFAKPPALAFLTIPQLNISSSQIRK